MEVYTVVMWYNLTKEERSYTHILTHHTHTHLHTHPYPPSQINLYKDVVDDVIKNVKDDFLNEGIDEQVLEELKQVRLQ